MTFGTFQKIREIERDGLTRTWLARAGDGREFNLGCIPSFAVEDIANRLGGTVLMDRVALLSGLAHANLRRVHGEGTAGGEWFVVLDPGPATWLPELIAKGPVTPAQAIPILGGLARALDYLHEKGVVVGSLHPAMIGLGDEGPVLSIGMDWIIQPQINKVEMDEIWPIGNPRYLCPEILRGSAPGAECDIYAFAMIAWEVLLGWGPFGGLSMMDEMLARLEGRVGEADGLPEPALAVLKRGLAADPALRWPSAGAFVDALERAVLVDTDVATRETFFAAMTMVRLEGTVAMAFAPAHSGTIIQLVGGPGRPVRVRVVAFREDASESEAFEVPWEAVSPALPALRETCTRPLSVRGNVDSSDAAIRLMLDLSWNQQTARLVLDAMATGLTGADAPVIDQIVEFLDDLAHSDERRRRLWRPVRPA